MGPETPGHSQIFGEATVSARGKETLVKAVNTIQGYNSNNQSTTGFTQPNNIIPPRVFRFGAQFGF